MQISDLREQVRRELLDFAWAEWAQMGLSAQVNRLDPWALDPEALLLFTVEIARWDPRLFDELLDWLAKNGRLLGTTRLRNLRSLHPGDRSLVDATLAWVGSTNPLLRWQVEPREQTPRRLRPVFDPSVVSFVQKGDPVFASFGYERTPVVRSQKSQAPDLRAPVNFAFVMRQLFGPGSRAEAMRILLTSDERPLNAAGIAEEAAFAKRNINDALLALADARVVKVRWAGNERLFTTYRDKWAQLLEVGPRGEALPTSRPWTRLLRALTAIHIWTEHADPEWSDYLVASEGRQLLESLAPELSVSGVDVSDLGRTLPHSGPEAIAAVIKRLLEHPRPGRAPRRRISSVDSSRVV